MVFSTDQREAARFPLSFIIMGARKILVRSLRSGNSFRVRGTFSSSPTGEVRAARLMTLMWNRSVPKASQDAIALHETHLEDQLAALAYLKQLSDVDPHRIVVAGCSYGGIQTVLAVEANAEQKLGLRAAIDFAGGAMSWRSLSLRDRMVRAIRKANIPVLFIQAENDYDLGPSRTLPVSLSN